MAGVCGKESGYHGGCRCPACREAARLSRERWRRRRGVEPRKRSRTHGRIATYQAGCRCDDCREASRLYRQKYQDLARARSNQPCQSHRYGDDWFCHRCGTPRYPTERVVA